MERKKLTEPHANKNVDTLEILSKRVDKIELTLKEKGISLTTNSARNPITKDNLNPNGWILNREERKRYDILAWEKNFLVNKKVFFCTIRNLSNTVGRDWSVHVENGCFETVGTMDVATYEQINSFLNLLAYEN